jgi:protein TonB
MRIEGRVYVEFIVNKDGKISEAKTVKGIGGGCDEEAERIVMEAPSWNPAKQRGRPVRQRMVLPITFKLADV